MNRFAKRALRFLIVTALVYAIGCGVVAFAYRAFLYPAPHGPPPAIADATLIETKTNDGVTARALRIGPADATTAIVFFHGNGEIAESGEALARQLASHGYQVVLAEYRGYGISRAEGSPNERGLYADAEAICAAVNVPNDHLVLMGFSLGTGVATEMAARGHGRALVLLAPYTSIPEVAQRDVPFFPMNALMRDKLDSLSKAPSIDIPAFVAHGDRDEVVPFDMGETVAHAFPHNHFVAVSGATHMTLFQRDDHLVDQIVDFVIGAIPI